MKKFLSVILVSAFALSFVGGIAVSNAQADDPVPPCMLIGCKVTPLGSFLEYCCRVPDFKGSANSPKAWYCYVDYEKPCEY